MEKQVDGSIGNYTHRRLAHLKVISRLIEHELSGAKGSKDLSMERDLVENVLDTLEMFIEDFEDMHGGRTGTRAAAESKPAVTRLN
jgi:hypothetical protein